MPFLPQSRNSWSCEFPTSQTRKKRDGPLYSGNPCYVTLAILLFFAFRPPRLDGKLCAFLCVCTVSIYIIKCRLHLILGIKDPLLFCFSFVFVQLRYFFVGDCCQSSSSPPPSNAALKRDILINMMREKRDHEKHFPEPYFILKPVPNIFAGKSCVVLLFTVLSRSANFALETGITFFLPLSPTRMHENWGPFSSNALISFFPEYGICPQTHTHFVSRKTYFIHFPFGENFQGCG